MSPFSTAASSCGLNLGGPMKITSCAATRCQESRLLRVNNSSRLREGEELPEQNSRAGLAWAGE
jgi:hypothetical protein